MEKNNDIFCLETAKEKDINFYNWVIYPLQNRKLNEDVANILNRRLKRKSLPTRRALEPILKKYIL